MLRIALNELVMCDEKDMLPGIKAENILRELKQRSKFNGYSLTEYQYRNNHTLLTLAYIGNFEKANILFNILLEDEQYKDIVIDTFDKLYYKEIKGFPDSRPINELIQKLEQITFIKEKKNAFIEEDAKLKDTQSKLKTPPGSPPKSSYESLNDKLPQTPPPSIWDIFGSSIKGIGKQDNAGAGAGAGAGTGVDSENTEESSETQDKGKGKSKGKRKELTIVRDVKDNMQPDRFEAHDCL